jgi:hypothetical protein
MGQLEGSELARARLGAMLEVLAGRRALAQACAQLGLRERRFRDLRLRALQAALASLEPRPAGRPARAPAAGEGEEALRATIRDLRLDLRAAQVREEIALALPGLLGRADRRAGGPTRTRGGRGGCAASARAAAGRSGGGRPGSATPAAASAASAPAPWPTAAGPPATG